MATRHPHRARACSTRGGRAGSKATVALSGWNLSATKLIAKDRDPGIHLLAGQPFQVGTLPETVRKPSNHSPAASIRRSIPCSS